MEENKIEINTKDKIVMLKNGLAAMELLGETIPQLTKDAVAQEIAQLEEKALEEVREIEANTVTFYEKYHTEINVIAALILIQSIFKFL